MRTVKASLEARNLRWRIRDLVFGVLLFAVASWCVIDGAYGLILEIRCQREGHLVEGVVLTKYHKRLGRGSIKGLLTWSLYEPRVSYRFSIPERLEMRGDFPVAEKRWRMLEERGPVLVRFVPTHPSFNRVEGEQEILAPAVTAGVGAILLGFWVLVIGLGFVIPAFLERFSRSKARRANKLTETVGTVTAVTGPTNGADGRRWWVEYRFADRNGHTRKARMELDEADFADADWRVGMTAPVLFKTENPDESVMMP